MRLALWFLDLKGSLLWAVLMAFLCYLSLLPFFVTFLCYLSLLLAIGAALIWLPLANYYLRLGVDRVWSIADRADRQLTMRRPSKHAPTMADYVVMITTLGCMAIIGINGYVLDLVIGSIFISVSDLHPTR